MPQANLRLKEFGPYVLSNDLDYKAIPDGYEIFAKSVALFGIDPEDFSSAYWIHGGGIIVEKIE